MRICDLIKDQDTYHAELGHTVLETVRPWSNETLARFRSFTAANWWESSQSEISCAGLLPRAGPRATCLAEVMTDDPLAVGMGEDLETCMTLMRRHGFRHLPVCHEGQLIGMVSLRDILLHDLSEKDDEVRMMRAYIHSMPDA